MVALGAIKVRSTQLALAAGSTRQRAPSTSRQAPLVLIGLHHHEATAHRARPWEESPAPAMQSRRGSHPTVPHLHPLHLYTVQRVRQAYLRFHLAIVPPRQRSTHQLVLITPHPVLSSLLPRLYTRQQVQYSVGLELPRRPRPVHLRRHPLTLQHLRSGRLHLLSIAPLRRWRDHLHHLCRPLILQAHQSSHRLPLLSKLIPVACSQRLLIYIALQPRQILIECLTSLMY
jgi:hypothetical protein